MDMSRSSISSGASASARAGDRAQRVCDVVRRGRAGVRSLWRHGGGRAIDGRGAAVSKSDFTTYAFAMLALKNNPVGLKGTVELHSTYDEETGGFVGP